MTQFNDNYRDRLLREHDDEIDANTESIANLTMRVDNIVVQSGGTIFDPSALQAEDVRINTRIDNLDLLTENDVNRLIGAQLPSPYDDTEVRNLIAGNTASINALVILSSSDVQTLIDASISQIPAPTPFDPSALEAADAALGRRIDNLNIPAPYNDQELRGLIQANTTAIAGIDTTGNTFDNTRNETRLDAIEANGWVTNIRIQDGVISLSKFDSNFRNQLTELENRIVENSNMFGRLEPRVFTIEQDDWVRNARIRNGEISFDKLDIDLQNRVNARYDDTAVRGLIQTNTNAIAGLNIPVAYDDTEVRGLIQANTNAINNLDIPDAYDDTEVRGLIQGNTDLITDQTNRINRDVIPSNYNGIILDDRISFLERRFNRDPVVDNPITNIVATTDDADRTINISDVFSDPDNNPLTYTITTTPQTDDITISGTLISFSPSNLGVSNTIVTIIANDGLGGSTTSSFNINIILPQRAPVVANPIADVSALGDADAITIDISNVFTDANNDPLTYAITSTPSNNGITLSGNTITISPILLTNETTYRITLTASDGRGGTATDTFDAIIQLPQLPPIVVNALPDITGVNVTDSNRTIDVSNVFRDPNNDPLTYSVDVFTNTTGIGVTGNNITINPSLLSRDALYDITLTANDGAGGTANDIFTLMTNDGGREVLTGDSFVNNENSFIVGITIFNNEIYLTNSRGLIVYDLNTRSFVRRLSSRGGSFLANNNNNEIYTIRLSGNTRLVSVINLMTGSEIRSFNLYSGDGLVRANTDTSGIAFHNNQIYVLDAPLTVANQIIYVYSLTGTYIRSFVLSLDNRRASGLEIYNNEIYVSDNRFTNGNTDIARPNRGQNRVYVYNLSGTHLTDFSVGFINVWDIAIVNNELYIPNQNNDPNTFEITRRINIYEIITNTITSTDIADINAFTNTPDRTIDLSTIFTSTNALTYTLDTLPTTNNVSLTGSNLRFDYSGFDRGTSYAVGITARDNFNSAVQRFNLNIGANRPPIVANALTNFAIRNVSPDRTIDISNTFTDPDDDPLTYSLSVSPTTNAITLSGTDISVDASELVTGNNHNVSVTASDEFGGSVTDSFNIDVVANRVPVVANALADISAFTSDAMRTIDISNVFSDPDGDTLTYTVSTSPSTTAISLMGTSLVVNPMALTGGTTYSVSVTASDGFGGSATDTFDVVIAANRAPTVANAIADITGLSTSDALRTIDISNVFTDPDNNPLTYTIAVSPTTTGIAIDDTDIAIVPSLLTANTTYEVTVTASDGQGGTVDDVFTVMTAPATITANSAVLRTNWQLNSANRNPRAVTQYNNEFYVADDNTDRVYVYSPTGTLLRNFPLNSGNRAPRGMTVFNDELYVLNFPSLTSVYNPTTGAFLRQLTGDSRTPTGITTLNNQFYSVDFNSDRISVYNIPSSTAFTQIRDFALNSNNRRPQGLSNYNDELYVLEDARSGVDSIHVYDTNGVLRTSFNLNSQHFNSRGITFYNDELYVVNSDPDSGRVNRMYIYTLSEERPPITTATFARSISINAGANRRIGQFNGNELVTTSGIYSTQGVRRVSPSTITGAGSGIDSHNGEIYGVTGNGDRVSIYSETGTLRTTWQLESRNTNAEGMTIYNGEVFVSDLGRNRGIYVYTPDGTFLRRWNLASGNTSPRGIASYQGEIYVTQRGNNTIYIYDINGVFRTTINVADVLGIAIIDGELFTDTGNVYTLS